MTRQSRQVAFYYLHRMMHHPALYKRFHKVHHEWKAPIALAASYAHPVEHALNNVLPLWLGPVVCHSHLATTYLWFAVAVVGTQLHHCGYRFWFAHLPWDHQPNFHDFHHENFSGNYGLLTLLDRLHGTDTAWRHRQQELQVKAATDGKQRITCSDPGSVSSKQQVFFN